MATNLGGVSLSRVLLWLAAILAVALAVGFVYKAFFEAPPESASAIASVDFHQSQAILDFDDSEYTQDDPAELATFAALLAEFDVVPGVTVTASEDNGCAGGLSTVATVNYADGKTADMFIATCGEPDYEDFNTQASDLFTQWRLALSK